MIDALLAHEKLPLMCGRLGFTLEKLLLVLRRVRVVRNEKVIDEPRPEARLVFDDNLRFQESLLDVSFGPAHALDHCPPGDRHP